MQSSGLSEETCETDPGRPGGSRGSASGPRRAPHLPGTGPGSPTGAGQRLGPSRALRERAGSGEGGRGEPQGGGGSREPCPEPAPGGTGLSGQSRRVALRGSSGSPGDGRRQRPSRMDARRSRSLARSGCVSLPRWASAAVHSAPLAGGPLRCGSPAQYSIIRAVITTIYLYRAPHARVSRVVF